MNELEKWWQSMWKLWSIRLGVVASTFIGWIAAYPQDWQEMVGKLPVEVRPLVGLLAFAAITYTRMKPQGGKNADPSNG